MLTRNCLLLFLWILVDAGSVSSSRPPSSSLLLLGRSRTGGRERARGLGGPMRNGRAGSQRVKRGWVWNQFFVLEEYMGSEPQYVGKVRRIKAHFCCYLWSGWCHESQSEGVWEKNWRAARFIADLGSDPEPLFSLIEVCVCVCFWLGRFCSHSGVDADPGSPLAVHRPQLLLCLITVTCWHVYKTGIEIHVQCRVDVVCVCVCL